MRRVPPVLFLGSAGVLLAAVLPLTAARAAAAPTAPTGTSQPPAGVGGGFPFPVPPRMAAPASAVPPAVPAGRVPAELAGLPADATAGEAQATQDLAVAAARQHGHRVAVDSLSGDRKTTFAAPDGTLSVVSYPTPVFHTESGHRVRTDASIVSVADAAYPRQAPHAVRPLGIGTDSAHLLRWDLPTGRITVRLAPASTAAPKGVGVPAPLPATAVSTAAGHVRLARALQHADLDVSSTPTGPRVDLVLADASAPRTLALLLDDPTGALGGLGAATPQGGWQFPADGGQYAITPPYAYQQAPAGNGQGMPPDPSSAHLTVTAAGAHSYLVTETVDSAWLAGKTFPIVLDPTIVDQYENAMWDCQLFDGSYQNNNYCPYGTNYYDAASNVGYTARALLRPDISILTNGGTYLRQAYFALYATGSDNNATHIHDLCAGGTFWGNGPNTTWANTAGGAPRGDQCVSFDATPNTYYRGVDVTPATRAALANQFPYYGFVLKNDNETWGYEYTQFDGAGGQHPSYFVINYGLPPNAPQNVTASINNAGTFTASWDTPAGSADADPVDGYTGYLYQCGHSGQDMVAGAWITETSGPKTWNYNGINPGQCYFYLLFPHNDAGYNNSAAVNALAQTYAQPPGFSSTSGGNQRVSGTVTYPSIDGSDGRYPFSSDRPYAVNQYLLFLYPTGQSWPYYLPLSCQVVAANGNQPTGFTFDSTHGTTGYCSTTPFTPSNNTFYSVQAFALNGSGASVVSGGYTAGTGDGVPVLSPSGAPSAPTNVTASAGDASVDLAWGEPQFSVPTASSYTVVTYDEGGSTSAPPPTVTYSGTHAHVSGLHNTNGYYFTVTANNGMSGPPSAGTPVVRPQSAEKVAAQAAGTVVQDPTTMDPTNSTGYLAGRTDSGSGVAAVQSDLVTDMTGDGTAQNLPADLTARQAMVNAPGWADSLRLRLSAYWEPASAGDRASSMQAALLHDATDAAAPGGSNYSFTPVQWQGIVVSGTSADALLVAHQTQDNTGGVQPSSASVATSYPDGQWHVMLTQVAGRWLLKSIEFSSSENQDMTPSAPAGTTTALVGPSGAAAPQAQTAAATQAFDRNGAHAYADSYAVNPAHHNPAYQYFGGNCTNFASQVLHEGGGIPPVGNIGARDTHNWYYNTGYSPDQYQRFSRSWTAARYNITHWAQTPGYTIRELHGNDLERTYNPMRQSDWIVFSSGNTSDRYYDWDHVAVEFDYGQGYDFVAQNSIDEKEQWNKFYWVGTNPMQRMNMRNVGYRLISANSSVGGRY